MEYWRPLILPLVRASAASIARRRNHSKPARFPQPACSATTGIWETDRTMNITFRQMRYFIAVAEIRSISGGGREHRHFAKRGHRRNPLHRGRS